MKCRIFRSTILLLAAISPASHAQSPINGHVINGRYFNSFFQISFAWPEAYVPVDLATLGLPAPASTDNEFLLFVARQGNQPYGFTLIAERLSPRIASPSRIVDGPDFLDRIAISHAGQPFTQVDREHFISPYGFVMDELDYKLGNEYDAGIAIKFGSFLLVFKCTAKNQRDLDTMTKFVRILHHEPSSSPARSPVP